MNKLKRTLALTAALVMTASAFVSCGKDDKSSSSSTSPTSAPAATSGENVTSGDEDPTSGAPADGKTEEVGAIDSSLGTGGDSFKVVSWNGDDANAMVKLYNANKGDLKDAEFVNMNCTGGEARAKYEQMFKANEEIDLYFVEVDWALAFIDGDKTVALDKLGFTDDNFADFYSYTDEVGKDMNGVRKGASWQAAAGGFAYRTDLAEEYLGVTSTADMQGKVSDWTNFKAAAKTVADASSKKTALADSLGGVWQVFSAGRTNPWVSNGTLQIDDSCKEFAELAKELWDMGGVAQYGQWNGDWTGIGATGGTMGYFVSTWGFGGFFAEAAGGKEEGKGSYGKWNVVQGPEEFFWGGTWMVVNPATDNAEECQQFIKTFAVDRATMKEYATSKPEYVNNKVVMEDVVAAGQYKNTEVYNNLQKQNYYEELHKSALKIDLKGLVTAYDSDVKAAFLEAVTDDYCKGGKSWDDTVASFKKKVKAANSVIKVD